MEKPLDPLAFWLDRPFDPHRRAKRALHRTRHQARVVTIRYRGSFGRSAVKALIVLALIAAIASFVGERPSPSLDANEVSAASGNAAASR